eukprot:TRINITY_DN47994_c0_g1_i1.p1 TRINITY_DN47994_c0_g1~~TRINITY_DN47994_c0_g1_i1.p1  ORF type:complete len:149 (+),score=18.31 TRINITY_DN47994_c0_g1_i1:166-612(+)
MGVRVARFLACRPPPLDLKVLPSDNPTISSFPACGVVIGSPRRLRDALTEVVRRNKTKDVACTLAVSDVTMLGSESLGVLQQYMEMYGEVDLIMQPRSSWAPGFVLVEMENIASAARIAAAGEYHVLGTVELSIFPLTAFLSRLQTSM